MPYIKAPYAKNRYIEVPDGLSDSEALAFAKNKRPQLFADTSKAEEGVLSNLKAGARGLIAQYGVAAAPMLGLSDAQVRSMIGKEQARQSEIAKAPSWEDVKENFAQHGVLGGEKPEERGGLSSLLSMWSSNIGQSLPQMGATMGGARLGAMAGTAAAPFLGPAAPFGPLVGGALGALGASIPAFTGSNIERQVQEQEKTKTEAPLEYGRAASAAVGQGVLDAAETALIFGKLGMGKALTNSLPKLAEKFGIQQSEAELVKAAKRSLLKATAVGAGKGVVVEMPTEVAQQILERWNAKLSLFDADARKEYEATAAAVAGPGALFGGVGGVSGRGAARTKLGEIQDARSAQEAQQRAAQERSVAAQQAGQEEFQQIPTQLAGQPVQTQTDLFQPIAGPYSQLGQQLAAAEEKPDLREEYRKTKSALDDVGARMQKAAETRDVTSYTELQPQFQQLTQAVSDIESAAKKQGIYTNVTPARISNATYALSKAMESGQPAEKVQALADKLQALRQQTVPSMEGTLFDPTTLNAVSQQQADEMQGSYFEPGVKYQAPAQKDMFAQSQAEYTDQQQETDAARVKELFNKERDARRQTAETEQAAGTAEQHAKVAPIESILVGQGRQLEETARRRNQITQLQEDADNGQLTPALQSLYGIQGVPEQTHDLNDPAVADSIVPKIQARLEELQQQRKTEFPNKTLEQNGVLTKDGKRLVGVEATIGELTNLLAKAKPTTAAESRVLNAVVQPPATPAPAPEAVEPGIARIRGDKAEQERRAALADFVEVIDTLRKGDFTDVPKQTLLKEANELRAKYIDAMLREAAYRRMERQRGSVTQDEAIKAAYAVNKRLQKLIEDAASRPREATGMLGAAIEKATEPQSKKIFEAAKAIAKLKERIKKAGPTVNVKELRAQLAEARQRFADEKAKYLPGQRKQDAIKRGMTISEVPPSGNAIVKGAKWKSEAARNTFELQQLRQELAALLQRSNMVEQAEKRADDLLQKRLEQGATERENQKTGAVRAMTQKKRSPRVTMEVEELQKQLEGAITAIRGMSTEDTNSLVAALKSKIETVALGQTEYSTLRNELGRVAYELAYPGGKKQVFKTPFDLKPSPAAALARAATPAQMESRITELRGQADTLANEMARLKKQYEASSKTNERKRLRKLGERYNEALSKANAEIRVLREKTGVGERTGVSEGDTVDMFKQLERQEAAAQRRTEEKKETYSPAVKAMFAQATKLRKNLHSLFDGTIKKYDAAVKALTAQYKQYAGIGSYANRFAQEAAAAQAVKDKALKGINTGLGRANVLLEKAEALHTQETAVAEKQKATKEAKQEKAEEKRRKAQAKPAAKPAPVVKKLTVAEAEESAQRQGLTQRYEVTDVERVKRLPEGTELADIEADRAELSKKIRTLGAQLGLEPRDALRPKLERTLATERERNVNNTRLGLLEKYEELGRQLVMPVREKIEAKEERPAPKLSSAPQTKVKEKPAGGETSEEMAGRVIPRQYAIALFDVQQVRDALKAKGLTPVKRKELEAKRRALNSKVMALEERAKRFDINLSMRAKPEETAVAQAKAVREGLAAAERQPPKRDPYLKTGSDEQKQAKAEGLARAKRKRNAKQGIEYEETETDIRNEESAILAGLVGHKGIVDFRLASTSDTGVDMKEAADVVARVKAALPAGVDFIYAPTLAQVPADLRGAMADQGHAAIKGAVLPDGRVVVVGEAHASIADLQKSIAHELIGHYGVDIVLGKAGVQKLVDSLFAKGTAHVAQVATGLGVFDDVGTAMHAMQSAKTAEIKTVLVREMIAQASEGRRVAPKFVEKVKAFLKDIISAVRGFFRNSGLSEAAKQDTKAIQSLIKQAHAELSKGQPGVYVSPNGQVAFRTKAAAKPAWMSQESWDMEQRVIAKDAPLFDTIKGNVLGLTGITQFVDRLAPFRAALEKGVVTKKITDLEATQALYNLSAHDKRMNFTRSVAANGPAQLVKKTEGGQTFFMVENKKDAFKATLIKVFKALGESGLAEDQAGRFFTMYMGAQRVKNEGIGVEALNFGKDKNGNPVLTAEKLRKFEVEIASQPKVKDAFEKARAIYNEYNKGLIDFAVQTGAINPEMAQNLLKRKDFIPFYRQVGGEIRLFIGDEKSPIIIGNLKDQPYLHELVGGETAITDIFTSAVQNTNMLTDMALRNLATKSTVQMLYKLGMLDTATTREARADSKETGNPPKTFAIRPGLGRADPTVIRFKDNGEDKHVVVKTEGTAFEHIPAELLVKGLEGIKTTFPKALEFLGIPAKFLRRAVILSPLYPVRQIVKDSFSVLGTAGADFIPIATPLKNVYSAMKGTNKSAITLEEQGLIGGQLLAAEGMEGMSTVLRQVTSGKQSVSSMLAWLEAKSMMADAGVRTSAYNSYLKQGLNQIEAWVAANELMDFNKRGISPSVYFANVLIPFFSAQIQGLNVLVKAMTGRMPFNERLKIKEKFYKRGMMLAGLALLYASANDDDEYYKNATPQQKYSNWFIRTPLFDEPLKIPIPYEFGFIFKAIPEAIFNTVFKDKPEEAGQVAKALVGIAYNSVPGLMPQAAKPFVEVMTGKDLYTGEDIESTKEKGLDAAKRFRDNTTELSKALGGMGVGLSPVQVDHFIKSAGTQSLLAVVSLSDVLFAGNKPPSPSMKTSQLPLIGGLFQPTDAGGIINRTYDLMEEATQAKNTYAKVLTEEGVEAAQKYAEANIGRIIIANSAGQFRSQMHSISDYEKTIRLGDMPPREKRERLDESRQLKIKIATQFRDMARQSF